VITSFALTQQKPKLKVNRTEQLNSVQPLPSYATVSANIPKSIHHKHN